MSYHIRLEVFEGPMDLLLHLIEKAEVDIYDIPIAQITEQYLEYLHAMQEMDLDVASEFLVMAATLLAIKARMLLPQEPAGDPESVEATTDPREELVARLLEYKKYKEAAAHLKSQEAAQARVYSRPVDVEAFISAFTPDNPLEGVSIWDLVGAMRDLLARVPAEEPVHEISRQEVTISEQMDVIISRLAGRPGGLLFRELFAGMVTRVGVVITFLALLELVRLQQVIIYQPRPFGDITIFLRTEEHPLVAAGQG